MSGAAAAGWLPLDVFGTELHRSRRVETISTAADPLTPVTYLSLGSAEDPMILPAGTYQATTSFFAGVETVNNELFVDVQNYGNPSPQGAIIRMGAAGAQKPVTAVNIETFAETTSLWFQLVFARKFGVGDVTMFQATFVLYRIA